ncbi:MAG: hypothetical protein Q8Q12_07655 [bacterium]|nr:hypothetical protein [bacterium]
MSFSLARFIYHHGVYDVPSSAVTADKWGLVTIEHVKVSKAGNRIRIAQR